LTDRLVEVASIRTFFALRLRDPIARQLASYADSLAVYDKKVEVQWVDSDNYHLTLCFLGDIAIDKVDEIASASKSLLSTKVSLNIHLEEIESYSSASDWTLLVAKTAASVELSSLHNLVMSIAKNAGIEIAEHGFKPHITLGRLGLGHSFVPPEQWPKIDLYSLADAVVLFQSKLGERGSVYTPLVTVELQDLA